MTDRDRTFQFLLRLRGDPRVTSLGNHQRPKRNIHCNCTPCKPSSLYGNMTSRTCVKRGGLNSICQPFHPC